MDQSLVKEKNAEAVGGSLRRLSVNIFAGSTATVLQTCANILLLPIYIKYLGMMGIGVLGVFQVIANVLRLFDMGLSASLSKQVAEERSGVWDGVSFIHVVRTYEVVFYLLAVLMFVLGSLGVWMIGGTWLGVERFGGMRIEVLLLIACGVATLRWCAGIYHAALVGRERIVTSNVIRLIDVMVYHTVSLSLLVGFEGDVGVKAFFVGVLVCAGLYWVLSFASIWAGRLREMMRANFDLQVLLGTWDFAAAMLGIMLVSTVLTQMDRVLVSGVMGLEVFGYYTLAMTIGSGIISVLSLPIYNAMFPRFVGMLKKGHLGACRRQYIYTMCLLTVVLLPMLGFVYLYSGEFIYVWTAELEVARFLKPVLFVLVLGPALNVFVVPAYTVLLAGGYEKHALVVGIALTIYAFVAYWVGLHWWGLYGLGIAAAVLYFLNVILLSGIMSRKLLGGVVGRYLVMGMLPGCALIVLSGYVVELFNVGDGVGRFELLMVLVGKGVFMLLVVGGGMMFFWRLMDARRNAELGDNEGGVMEGVAHDYVAKESV
ncbi:colanic acid exporter [Poriferisphaera corsica]|uniref:Colanic acid exporter n=1 Tax=Poriferisphaera corsica TaxID=2528020 RepID=A0A517YPB3_9BACT|nr:lipopolysaccharide biosynthesis protein [Poriferisphaera corsica]QDU32057.1 colanic acid exporter [Poriferisphaera corsica]